MRIYQTIFFLTYTRIPTITCRKCIQFWKGPTSQSPFKCGPNSETCTGNACFMRQCKRCTAYQYISGCVRMTEWQIRDLQLSRQKAELLNTRAGASLLCEDNTNYTTCICNRRDKCNDIHTRTPFSTYIGPLFHGIVNIEAGISEFETVLHTPLRSGHSSFFTPWSYNYSKNIIPNNCLLIIAFILSCSFMILKNY